MTTPALYLVATRHAYKATRYRTRYYRETVDGFPRFTDKKRAVRMPEQVAHDVAAQLRQRSPGQPFVVLSDCARPPRVKWPTMPYRPKPEQAQF